MYGISTDGEKHNETEGDMLVGAAGGVYPLLDPQSKSEVGTEAANKAEILPQPATTASTGNPFVAGLNMTDGHKGADKSADHGVTTQPQVPIVNGEKKLQEKNDQGIPAFTGKCFVIKFKRWHQKSCEN